MFSNKKIYFFIIVMIAFSGCAQKNTSNVKIEKKHLSIENQKTKNVKKVYKYRYCNKHKKIMNHASKYILNEFEKGYFRENDILGAKAQLFLIDNKSPSIFAKNINLAMNSYKKQYNLAKKYGCNIKKYRIFPIQKIRNKIKKKIKNEIK